ncbi:MAG: HAD hydrolase-like protein [Candidatus Saccharimonadales bacterium]
MNSDIKRHIIFDFDGTLVDSLPVAIQIAQEMVPKLDLSPAQIEAFRQLPAKEIIKQSGIPYWRLPKLLLKGKKVLLSRLDQLHLFPGVAQAIKQLHKDGYDLSVVSSNSESIIRQVLEREGVEDCFEGVYGNIGLFSKTRAFKAVLRDQKVPLSQAVYVGDEVRDIESAHKAKLPVVAVSWGYNSYEILKKYQPTRLVSKTSQLVEVLESLEPTA